MTVNLGRYAKALAALGGSVITVIVQLYPHATWVPIVTAIGTVIAVYAVPNTPAPAAVPLSPARKDPP
jgi:hypothetical protein